MQQVLVASIPTVIVETSNTEYAIMNWTALFDAITAAYWIALFDAITAAFKFFTGLFGTQKAVVEAEPVDAQAARAGTAAGAAANAASHGAGKERVS
jgi:putative effector of murein hydrolase